MNRFQRSRRLLRSSWRKVRSHHHSHADHSHADHSHAGCHALCCARSGDCVRICGFAEACHHAARLREMGLREGVRLQVLRDGDPLIVRVDDTRLAVGRDAAEQISCEAWCDGR